jgi:hypothetical protein
LRRRAGQHSSTSAFACAMQWSRHSYAMQPTQGRAAHVSVIRTFEYIRASWEVGQGSFRIGNAGENGRTDYRSRPTSCGVIWYQSFGLHEVQIETRYLERNREGSQFKQR